MRDAQKGGRDIIMAKKLTPKQKIFVEEYAKTKNGVKAALKAYDTTDYSTAGSIAVENLQKPAIRSITEQLFPIEKTQQIVDNLHKLAISAEQEETQVKATKEYLDRAIPKNDIPQSVQFNQIQIDQRGKYDL